MDISASIVIYKNELGVLKKSVDSFLQSNISGKLFLIDNSPTNQLERIIKSNRIEYIHNPSNPGFGSAHNIAIDIALKSGFKYHLVLNPDVYFDLDVIITMVKYMESQLDVGMMMPKVLNGNGTIQYLPKLLPNPFWIFRRKLKRIDPLGKRFIDNYELRNFPKDIIYNVPILSGCFTLLRLDAIKEIGMYDENFFMYFEDFDLSRRMHQKYKTIYFPDVAAYHGYEGGANKSFKLFKIFIKSMITYFNKWGWFFDKERKNMNIMALEQFKS